MSPIDGANNVNQYTAIDDETSTCPTPSTPVEELVYDADGNLVSDGTRVYSWDAENRLVAVAPAVPAAGDKKVVFTYDYMSRRVQKRVFAWNATLNGGAGDWEANPEVYQRFVYDQWNVVLVLDGPNRTITHKYTWGLDLSGLVGAGAQSRDREGEVPGIHNAGGIGGLLAVEAPQAVGDPLRHWYFYDGNGDVGQLLAYDATGPTVSTTPAAKYEYDPYGQLVQTAGTYADANPFRFSTKWFDTTTGLGDWGYRYYSPRLGRWMSRDPIEEEGGTHLYAALGNNALNQYDNWGLRMVHPTDPRIIPGTGFPMYSKECESCLSCAQRLRRAATDATNALVNAGELVGNNHGPADAYRHCLGSCLAKEQCGWLCAYVAGWGNEILHGGSPEENDMDHANNRMGRIAAGDPAGCASACMGMLRGGRLQTEPKPPKPPRSLPPFPRDFPMAPWSQ